MGLSETSDEERMQKYRDPEYIQQIFEPVSSEHITCEICRHCYTSRCPFRGQPVQFCAAFELFSQDVDEVEERIMTLLGVTQ